MQNYLIVCGKVLTYCDFDFPPSLSYTNVPFSTSSLQPSFLSLIPHETPYAAAYGPPSLLRVHTPPSTYPLDSLVTTTDTDLEPQTSDAFVSAIVSESPSSSKTSQTAPASAIADLKFSSFPDHLSIFLPVTQIKTLSQSRNLEDSFLDFVRIFSVSLHAILSSTEFDITAASTCNECSNQKDV